MTVGGVVDVVVVCGDCTSPSIYIRFSSGSSYASLQIDDAKKCRVSIHRVSSLFDVEMSNSKTLRVKAEKPSFLRNRMNWFQDDTFDHSSRKSDLFERTKVQAD